MNDDVRRKIRKEVMEAASLVGVQFDPDRPVYHYTKASTAKLILEGCTLRATSLECVNDKTDYIHGESVFLDAISALQEPTIQRFKETLLAELNDPVKQKDRQRDAHTVCFSFDVSEHLWEKYGDCGRGYAIGMRVVDINAKFRPLGWSGRVHYCSAEQRQLADAVLNVFGGYFRGPSQLINVDLGDIRAFAQDAIWAYSTLMKDEKQWGEENEFRYTVRLSSDALNYALPGYRSPLTETNDRGEKKQDLQMYACSDKEAQIELPIAEVVAGPHANIDEAREWLQDERYQNVTIRQSTI